MRLRLRCVLEHMGTERFSRLLEVGYGSGLLIPELSRRASGVVGLDTHDRGRDVCEMLKLEGVHGVVELFQGSVTAIPSPDQLFDACVAISILEHVGNIDLAI